MSFYDLEDIIEASTIPGLTVITAPDLLRPHLAAGETCIWIGAPESIELEGYGQGTCIRISAIPSPRSPNSSNTRASSSRASQ